MAVTYLNWRGPQGRETIDEIDPADFPCYKEFSDERRRLIDEYAMAGMPPYASSRACANWKD